MRLKNIIAAPHPSGNRIDLIWINPDPEQFPNVRLVRREGTHPILPQPGSASDGIVIADSNLTLSEHGKIVIKETEEGRLYCTTDKNLKGETVYYYSLFPYAGDTPDDQVDTHNRVSAIATSTHNIAGQMSDLLPGIYHRYDTVLHKPEDNVSNEDRQKGQLRRFLDLPGGQLDQLYSFAKATLDLHDLARVDGNLLPLLAEWIGWNLDHTLEIESQRNEVRNAPAIYKTIGIIPTVEATVKRITNWESRTKEFFHNVFTSNSPERLNIWTLRRNNDGTWSEHPELLSLDFAYEGRPAAIMDGDGALRFFYHTYRKDKIDLWYKTLFMFDDVLALQNDLDNGFVPVKLLQEFNDKGYRISEDSRVDKQEDVEDSRVDKREDVWVITDKETEHEYIVQQEGDELTVWTPSLPLVTGDLLDKHPTSVTQGGKLWVLWNAYNDRDRTWCIKYLTLRDGEWSPNAILTTEPPEDPKVERKQPCVTVDDADGLWLFWMELEDSHWMMKYNVHSGDAALATDFLTNAISFPQDTLGEDPRVEDDLLVLFHPAAPSQRIWVFLGKKANNQ